MKMLIAIAGAQRGHIHHPETISECSEKAGGLKSHAKAAGLGGPTQAGYSCGMLPVKVILPKRRANP
jgi:hypothetical protein